jgi:hypothetical protein
MTTGHLPPDDRYVHAGAWGEIVMNRTQRIRRRCAATLAALAAATTATTGAGWAPATFAAPVPPPGTGDAGRGDPFAPAHTATVGGIHGWQIILIAIGAVLAGAVLAVLHDRTRAARQARLTAHITRA